MPILSEVVCERSQIISDAKVVAYAMSLAGKVCVVTGAGSGIGRATCLALSREGAAVILVGRRLRRLKETRSLLHRSSGESLVVQADVSKESDAKKIVRRTLQKFGKLDILVNNAGIGGHTNVFLKFLRESGIEFWMLT